MNIWLTFDYELFFGNPTGSAEKCMLEPVQRLLELSKKHNAPMTFFVDAGYLWKLNALATTYPELSVTYALIASQLQEIIAIGSDVQFHLHPHWEKASYEAGTWHIPQDNFYSLNDFSKDDAERIFLKYKAHLEDITGRSTIAYRAGGWCIQPFSHIKDPFQTTGLRFDSSVVAGMKFQGGVYNIDFSRAPVNRDWWYFENDPCQPEEKGAFVELPIATYWYKPVFYWELYIRGRLNKKRHQFIGDGNYIPQPGRKWDTLTKAQYNHASCDGFYASQMQSITRLFEKEKRQHLVFIGHPKSMTAYSFDKLEQFLAQESKKHHFQTFDKFHAEFH